MSMTDLSQFKMRVPPSTLFRRVKTCAGAGLRLHKLSMNKKKVIQGVAPDDSAKGLQGLDRTKDSFPIERTLGIIWCAESDSFRFRIVIQDRPLTRWGIL